MHISSNFRRTLLGKTLFILAMGLLTLCLSSSAYAGGRIVWKKTTIKERLDKNSWLLKMEIHLSRAPQVSYLPVKVEFKPTAYYERALVDGKDAPIERTVVLRNQPSLIESVDVGFRDPGSGVIQSRTRFKFKVNRAHEFVAGEYRVTIKNARTGKKIGATTTLRLKGENPAIDRRSIDFSAPKKKKKEKPAEAKTEQPAEETTDEPHEEQAAEPAAAADVSNEPPAIKERPGGCQYTPSNSSQWSIFLALAGLGLMLRRISAARRNEDY